MNINKNQNCCPTTPNFPQFSFIHTHTYTNSTGALRKLNMYTTINVSQNDLGSKEFLLLYTHSYFSFTYVCTCIKIRDILFQDRTHFHCKNSVKVFANESISFFAMERNGSNESPKKSVWIKKLACPNLRLKQKKIQAKRNVRRTHLLNIRYNIILFY